MTWWLAAVAIILGLLGVAWWRTRAALLRWWRLRRHPHRTRYPIVLVHGVMGFDQLQVGERRHEYFRGIEAHLAALGATVYRPRLPPLSGVAERAAVLSAFVNGLGVARVNVIAHSMGGLDTRFAIERLGLGPKVASLVTVGTPHRGTPLADVGASVLDRSGLRLLSKTLGLEVDAFHDMTARGLRFSAGRLSEKGIYCGSVIARASPERGPTALLRPTYRFLRRHGDNDGLVTTDSQAFGEVLREVEADHWQQVGWGDGFDAPALYADVVQELRARGL